MCVLVHLSPLLCAMEDTPASPPSPFEVFGPFIAWGPPERHDGEILRYEVKITSVTGAYMILEKNKMDAYHILEKQDVPSDLGRSPMIGIKVMYAHTSSQSTLCHHILKAHNFLGNKVS